MQRLALFLLLVAFLMSRQTPRVFARSMGTAPRPNWTPEILAYDKEINKYYDEKRGSYWWPWRRDAFDKCLNEHYNPKGAPYHARQAIWYCHYSQPDIWWW